MTRFGVRVKIVPGAGHSPMVEQPRAVYKLLTELDPPPRVVKRITVIGETRER